MGLPPGVSSTRPTLQKARGPGSSRFRATIATKPDAPQTFNPTRCSQAHRGKRLRREINMRRTGAVALLLMLVTTRTQAEELVVAAWYGNELRGHRTASGEMFDPDGLTAAHRSLPFGTCLVVGNPRTGQTVSVRVNDRGPFATGLTLDLSSGQ